MSKRIGALRWDDRTFEGEGATLDLAITAAHKQRIGFIEDQYPDMNDRIRVFGTVYVEEIQVEYDLFTRVTVTTEGIVYRAILRA